MKKSALLISGGHIDNKFVSEYIEQKKYDLIIAIDGGLKKADELGIRPTHIVGDFDTISKDILSKYEKESDIEIKRLVPEKDFTDTQVAIMMAMENNCSDVVIIGGTGTRLDHTIANIHTMQMMLGKCENAVIINENNRIRLIESSCEFRREKLFGKYISFLPLTERVEGITLKGFKYSLENDVFDVKSTYSLGVSNEAVEDIVNVEVKNGILIMIESRD